VVSLRSAGQGETRLTIAAGTVTDVLPVRVGPPRGLGLTPEPPGLELPRPEGVPGVVRPELPGGEPGIELPRPGDPTAPGSSPGLPGSAGPTD